MTRVVAYIGLGSNLENPQMQVEAAFTELDRLPDSELLERSSLYASAPMGPADQPDYINAAAALKTGLSPLALLDGLQAIEQRHRRKRTVHWGPRTLDLDILLYGEQQIDNHRLQVPHPGMALRNFVLYPLAEIAGNLDVPGADTLKSLLAQCRDTGLQRLNEIAS